MWKEIDQARHNKQAYVVVKISNRKILKADINPSRALMCGASFFSRSQRKPNDVGRSSQSQFADGGGNLTQDHVSKRMHAEWRQAVKWNIKTLFPTSDCSKRSCSFHLALCKGLRRWRELASYPFILFLECFLRRRLRDATKRWFVGSHSKEEIEFTARCISVGLLRGYSWHPGNQVSCCAVRKFIRIECKGDSWSLHLVKWLAAGSNYQLPITRQV